ncbi:hypothetical protein R1flu_015015 [Riccia fluitans]|uniref:Uncharacterized protein n=1 Tax=Riccia fluitans TaxID=41844 RepID=A0ABD1YIU7_9MARC
MALFGRGIWHRGRGNMVNCERGRAIGLTNLEGRGDVKTRELGKSTINLNLIGRSRPLGRTNRTTDTDRKRGRSLVRNQRTNGSGIVMKPEGNELTTAISTTSGDSPDRTNMDIEGKWTSDTTRAKSTWQRESDASNVEDGLERMRVNELSIMK